MLGFLETQQSKQLGPNLTLAPMTSKGLYDITPAKQLAANALKIYSTWKKGIVLGFATQYLLSLKENK